MHFNYPSTSVQRERVVEPVAVGVRFKRAEIKSVASEMVTPRTVEKLK